MKPTTYYIQNRKGVCIKANNIKGLTEYCVPESTVRLYLKLERMKMNEDPSYRPRPVIFRLEKDKLKSIIAEVKRKVKDLMGEDHIALQVQSNNVPVILLIEKKYGKEDKAETESK